MEGFNHDPVLLIVNMEERAFDDLVLLPEGGGNENPPLDCGFDDIHAGHLQVLPILLESCYFLAVLSILSKGA
jgi:hypothetical protein